jgi:hypothetical protein
MLRKIKRNTPFEKPAKLLVELCVQFRTPCGLLIEKTQEANGQHTSDSRDESAVLHCLARDVDRDVLACPRLLSGTATNSGAVLWV